MKHFTVLVLLGLALVFTTMLSVASGKEYKFTQDGWHLAFSPFTPSGGKIIGSFSGDDLNNNGIIELANNEVTSYLVEFTGSIFTQDFTHTLDDLFFFEYTIGSTGFPPSFPLYSAGGGFGYDADDRAILELPGSIFLEVTLQPALIVPVPAVIDIKPRKKPEDVISLKNDKNLKVAIVGEETFDALQVDPATVKFGSNGASPVRFKGQDYNRDGFPDLILTFKLNETGIACGDTEATLTGGTYGGDVIEGSDSFTVEPCP